MFIPEPQRIIDRYLLKVPCEFRRLDILQH
jgi:hypothetical protein